MKRDSTVLNGSTFLVTDEEGRQTRGHDGFYHRDTRHLDSYRLAASTDLLETLEVVDVRPGERLFHLCDPLEEGTRTLLVSRRQAVTDGLYEQIRVANLTNEPLETTLTLALGTAFEDLFEVRGYTSEPHRVRDVAVERDPDVGRSVDRVTFRYDPADLDTAWETTVTVTGGGVGDGVSGEGRADATVEFDLDLGPRQECLRYVAVDTDAPSDDPEAAYGTALNAVADREAAWNDATEDLTTDHVGSLVDLESWTDVLEESRENLLELRLETEQGPVFAAGVPWFATAFGRDSLIAAFQALPLTTAPAKGTCRYLAAHQADAVDEFRHAAPGKILHEIRHGELTLREEVPHAPYYGTVDATALFVVLVHETWAWTGDDAFVEEVWPHVERGLAWLDEYGDRDDDGFLEYPTGGGDSGGLTHRAWKDSGDGIVHPDGTHPEGPLAVAEAQGYAYDAKRRAAALARDVMDAPDLAATLDSAAADLRERFDDAFWLPDEEFYAVAVDGNGNPVETVTTNPGHCLWSGLPPETRANAVVDRLVADDMFSGWGVRTVSATHPVYNPQSYHLGSVWPHDSSLVALGMARYGRVDAACRVAEGLVEAARIRGNDRLPELFAGFSRDETEVPVEYGEACEPQAWAAATPLACLRVVTERDDPVELR